MFPRTVNQQPAPAVEGDFASANPRASTLGGEAAFVAGPAGVIVARFAWKQADNRIVNSFGTGGRAPDGFVHRDMQALITTYLTEFGMVIPGGFGVTIHNEGDFWMKLTGSVAADGSGQQVFANFADGTGSLGSAPAGTTGTGSIGATATGAATSGSNQLTTSAQTGIISVGDSVASGGGIDVGTTILAGPAGGGAGVYTLSKVTTGVVAGTVTTFGNVLNLTAAAGVVKVGDPFTGTGVPTGASIASQVSGATGGVGVYTLNVPATAYVASTALTFLGGIGTNFYARSIAAVGELVKISTWGKA